MKPLIYTFALLCLLHFDSWAGWKIVQIVRSSEEGDYVTTLYIQDNKIRETSEMMDFIVDLSNNTMIYINHNNQTFWEGDKDTFLKEMQEAMDKAMKETLGEEGYQEYKKALEQNAFNPESEMEKTKIEIVDENDEISLAGFTGRKFSVLENGNLVEEVWVCNDIKVMDEVNMVALGGFFGEDVAYDYSESEEYGNLLKNHGFPIKEINYSYGEVMDETEIEEVTELDIPGSTFQPPAGYRKAALMEVMNY